MDGVSVAIGDELAGYRIDSFVARGGMAVVYRATDVRLSRPVALKIIAPELASDERFRQRFMRESELAASIDHPNIIPIYGAGETDGRLYIAMRYVQGEDLGQLLDRERWMQSSDLLPIFVQVSRALDAAHNIGLVHRDVKPGNVLLSASGEARGGSHVYLTDFGLTKRASSLTGITETGHFLGTIAYAAPEQISSKPVGPQTDVYSMGCMLFHALTGSPPYERDDDAALLWAHLSEPAPSVRSLRPELPAALDELFGHVLAKEPSERPATCREVIAELTDILDRAQVGVETTPVSIHLPGVDRVSKRPVEERQAPVPRPERQVASRQAGRPHAPRRWLYAGAAVILAAAAVAIGLVVGGLSSSSGVTYVTYAATSPAEANLSFVHPATWREQLHANLFVVFAGAKVDQFFTPGGDWTLVRSDALGAPERVTGVLAATRLGNDTNTHAELLQFLPASPTSQSLTSSSLAGQPADRWDGTIKDPTSSATLRFRAFIASGLPDANHTAVVMFFAPPNAFSGAEPTFDRILASVRPG